MSDVQIYSTAIRFAPAAIIRDLFGGMARVQLWSAFAWDEIQQRYRRSRLGLAWIVVSYLLFVGAIAFFFGGFSSMGGGRFTAYVAVNYAIFLFLLASLTDGCDVFRVATSWIKSTPLPHSIYVYKSIARALFVLVVNLIVAFVILAATDELPGPIALWSIPAFVVLLLNAVWVQIVFGYAAARFRDLTHLMQSITRVLFFITPILWVREERGGMIARVADFNPFTHALEIFSAPLLGSMPRQESWIFVGCLTVVGYVLAILVGGYGYRRLPYWL